MSSTSRRKTAPAPQTSSAAKETSVLQRTCLLLPADGTCQPGPLTLLPLRCLGRTGSLISDCKQGGRVFTLGGAPRTGEGFYPRLASCVVSWSRSSRGAFWGRSPAEGQLGPTPCCLVWRQQRECRTPRQGRRPRGHPCQARKPASFTVTASSASSTPS